MLGHLMTLEGFTPRIAASGADAESAIGRQPPHLVLLDVVLPDADGFDILARMKQDSSRQSIPVILVTGRTTREGVMRGLAGGADGYITKPIAYEALANGVKSVLGLGAAPDEEGGAGAKALDADDTLAGLAKEYRNGLALKLARVEQLAKLDQWQELHRLAHSMAGSAPSFGLTEVGAAAKALEDALAAKDFDQAERLVAALRTVASAAR
jgi:CheY-like chemotaxis protein